MDTTTQWLGRGRTSSAGAFLRGQPLHERACSERVEVRRRLLFRPPTSDDASVSQPNERATALATIHTVPRRVAKRASPAASVAHAPVALEVIDVVPVAGRESGCVRGAQCGRFGDARTHDRRRGCRPGIASAVRSRPCRRRRAALRGWMPRILFHRGEHVTRLISRCLERCASRCAPWSRSE